jgi:hypothetical protein
MSSRIVTSSYMSYNLTLQCGCVVYVACHPQAGFAHTRIIQSIGSHCRVRRHEVGLRLYLWELLPDAEFRPEHTRPFEERRMGRM